ncbi:STAS/SEC14 domain-containing protein [Thalassoporum mexicanum]|uniref:STAS/SEC14 domain-containing protein n=1 Tax=Thalassoporum mexicanum TaxID=3457544 RepID=UPI0018DDE7A0|nr:STAS/SEC14 domain-containing protein [Pseudanabaena sp. PCC 7367]
MVEVLVDGKVTNADINSILPQMEKFIAQQGTVKMIEIVKDFSGFELSMLGKAIKFDIDHLKDFSHCAVVTDSGWIGPFARAISPFLNIQLKMFKMEQKQEALDWLKAA